MAFDPALLAILACPNCDSRPPLKEAVGASADEIRLVCTLCGRQYPVVDGIPHLLPESALTDNPPGEIDA